MSVVHKTVDDTCIPQFSVSRLGITTQHVLKDVVPFLNADDQVEEVVRQELKMLIGRLVKATELNMLANKYMIMAQTYFRDVFRDAEDPEETIELTDLETVSKFTLLARANVLDSQTPYSEVRRGFQLVFNDFLQKRGATVVIRTESTVAKTGHLKIEHKTVEKMGVDMLRHLEEAEKFTQDLVVWLTEFYGMTQSFLQDETASLDTPLFSLPFYSPGWKAKLETLMLNLDDAEEEWRIVQVNYKTLFSVTHKNIFYHLHNDTKAREETVRLPPSKVRVPEILEPVKVRKYTPFPSQLMSEIFVPGTGILCYMTLSDVDHTTPGVSSIAMSFTAKSVAHLGMYNRISILCTVCPLDLAELSANSIRLVEHHPTSSKDMETSPANWRPRLRASKSESEVEWVFSQKIWDGLNTASPFTIPLFLTIEHNIDVLLNFHVEIVRRRYMFGNLVDNCICKAVVQASEDRTSPGQEWYRRS